MIPDKIYLNDKMYELDLYEVSDLCGMDDVRAEYSYAHRHSRLTETIVFQGSRSEFMYQVERYAKT